MFYNFNMTNQTVPRFKRHQNFVADIKQAACGSVLSLPYSERCEYVTKTASCEETVHFFNYIDLLYCKISPKSHWEMVISLILILIICAAFFLLIGVTADSFFCPSLAMFAHILGMSENVAGVTLVAIGNGAPDIFSSVIFIESDERRLFADIFSSAMLVVFLVGGIIIAITPFETPPYYFMRDTLFLLMDILFVDYIIKRDHAISFLESSLTFGIYICYIFVVFMDQFLVKRATAHLEKRNRLEAISETDMNRLKALRSQGIITFMSLASLHSRRSRVRISFTRDFDEPAIFSSNHKLFHQLWHTITQLNMEDWSTSSKLMRVFLVFRMPFVFILVLLLPRIDLDMEDHGWSKLLNCTQILALPCLICIDWIGFRSFMQVPIVLIILAISLPVAVITFIITRTDTVPSFHKYFSVLGMVGSVFVLRICCCEIISILSVLAIVTGLSGSFYGCSLLAFGNSMGDLMSNIALARQGYQNMALSACFGAPLFNSLLAVGPTLLWKSFEDENFMIDDFGTGTMGENSGMFLKMGLLSTLLGAATCNFKLRPSQGINNICFYCTFLTFIVLGELEIIHTFGSDHRMDHRLEEGL